MNFYSLPCISDELTIKIFYLKGNQINCKRNPTTSLQAPNSGNGKINKPIPALQNNSEKLPMLENCEKSSDEGQEMETGPLVLVNQISPSPKITPNRELVTRVLCVLKR